MKRWHRSMKRRPKNFTDILVIYKNGDVCINMYDYGYLYDGDWTSDVWEKESQEIKQWAYVDKYFEKELKDDKDNT